MPNRACSSLPTTDRKENPCDTPDPKETSVTLDSRGRCDRCHGTVRNVPGKRLSRERLEAIHDDICPGNRPKGTDR